MFMGFHHLIRTSTSVQQVSFCPTTSDKTQGHDTDLDDDNDIILWELRVGVLCLLLYASTGFLQTRMIRCRLYALHDFSCVMFVGTLHVVLCHLYY
jgi:hypothetical protein